MVQTPARMVQQSTAKKGEPVAPHVYRKVRSPTDDMPCRLEIWTDNHACIHVQSFQTIQHSTTSAQPTPPPPPPHHHLPEPQLASHDSQLLPLQAMGLLQQPSWLLLLLLSLLLLLLLALLQLLSLQAGDRVCCVLQQVLPDNLCHQQRHLTHLNRQVSPCLVLSLQHSTAQHGLGILPAVVQAR